VTTEGLDETTPTERRAVMTWAQRLKRAFGIDIETCPACGGAVRIIACIEDPVVIEKILTPWMRERQGPKLCCGRRAGRHRSGGLFDETG
jgi:hypothetical protein